MSKNIPGSFKCDSNYINRTYSYQSIDKAFLLIEFDFKTKEITSNSNNK